MLFLDNERTFDRQLTFSLSWEFQSSSTLDKFSQKGADGGTWQKHSSQVFPKWVGGTWTIYPLMIKLISLAFLYCPIRIRDQGCENQNPVTYFKTYFIKQKNGACDIGSQEVNIQQKKIIKRFISSISIDMPKRQYGIFWKQLEWTLKVKLSQNLFMVDLLNWI